VLTLAYPCSEEHNGEEYFSDYDEFWGLRAPSDVPVEAEDKVASSSYHLFVLKTFELSCDCNKRWCNGLTLVRFITVYWYFTHDVYHMCVNWILAHIWDAFSFLRKIRCDKRPHPLANIRQARQPLYHMQYSSNLHQQLYIGFYSPEAQTSIKLAVFSVSHVLVRNLRVLSLRFHLAECWGIRKNLTFSKRRVCRDSWITFGVRSSVRERATSMKSS
jgi:hypothetical protein